MHLHPENLILENYNTEDFRRLLGVNFFEDTIWFNKEAFEEAFFYVPLFLVLESDAALEEVKRAAKAKKGKNSKVKTASVASGTLPEIIFNEEKWFDRIRTIGFIMDMFHRAETVSEYKLDLLLEALSKKSKGKTETKKASQKKGGNV
jgi:predicted 3-demethylubiquinone-9 3-methyltransferase (glyoxalase superfamily)